MDIYICKTACHIRSSLDLWELLAFYCLIGFRQSKCRFIDLSSWHSLVNSAYHPSSIYYTQRETVERRLPKKATRTLVWLSCKTMSQSFTRTLEDLLQFMVDKESDSTYFRHCFVVATKKGPKRKGIHSMISWQVELSEIVSSRLSSSSITWPPQWQSTS